MTDQARQIDAIERSVVDEIETMCAEGVIGVSTIIEDVCEGETVISRDLRNVSFVAFLRPSPFYLKNGSEEDVESRLRAAIARALETD